MQKHEVAGANTVLVDMDGVMADFEEPNNDIIRTYFPGIIPMVNRTDFYFTDTYQSYAGVNARIELAVRQPGFIRAFPVVDGAVQGWKRILDAGYTPRVCSSPLINHETIIAEKIGWLEEHFVSIFGSWVIDTAIFNRDKSGYDAAAMIDDRPTLRNIEKAVWQHIVFNRSYNTLVETQFRLHDWHDKNLESLLARAKTKYLARG